MAATAATLPTPLIWYHEIPYGHTVFQDSMKYSMAIRYFIMNHEIWYHEIPYGHTVFHDSMKYRMAIIMVFHEIPYEIPVPYEIPYGHTVFHNES